MSAKIGYYIERGVDAHELWENTHGIVGYDALTVVIDPALEVDVLEKVGQKLVRGSRREVFLKNGPQGFVVHEGDISDPSYTPTLDEALGDLNGFVEGMTEF